MSARDSFHETDPVDEHFNHCMEIWVRFMRADERPQGFSGLDSVCGRTLTNFMVTEDDAEIVYEKSDRKLGGIVNACVESLAPHERAAIYKAHGLASVWRFPRVDMEAALMDGMARLRQLIAKRC